MCQVPSTTRTRAFSPPPRGSDRTAASHSVVTTRPGLLKAAGPRAAFLRARGRAGRFARRLTLIARDASRGVEGGGVEIDFPFQIGLHGLAALLIRLEHHIVGLVEESALARLEREPHPLPRRGAM